MPFATPSSTIGLQPFLKSLKGKPGDSSVVHLISLLKRRQIKNSRPCAIATTHLLLRIVAELKFKTTSQLTDQLRDVGRRLAEAQPLEPVVGNIVRRVLGLVHEVTDDDVDHDMKDAKDGRKKASAAGQVSVFEDSFFSLMSNYDMTQRTDTEDQPIRASSAVQVNSTDGKQAELSMRDVKDDVLNGIREMLDEIDQADEQVAGYALEHIYPDEVILTSTASTTVQKFLLAAAKKRRFSVIYVESYPNEHQDTYEMVLYGRKTGAAVGADENRFKPLTSAGIKVTVIPDSNLWAVMAQVNKVFLSASFVFANGGFMSATGAKMIAKAAKMHETPVTVLSGVYKLSPLRALDTEQFVEYGDPGKILDYRSGSLHDSVNVVNPLHDYVPPDLVDQYVTNLGGCASSFMYRIAADHYREEDFDL